MAKDDTHSAKPEKFNGMYFRRWQNQMRFWLTTLGLISAIDGSSPPDDTPIGSDSVTSHSSTPGPKPKTPKEIDYHCFHRILSALSEKLYDIFFEHKSAKELWDALDEEYGLDDAGINRFNSSNFNKFKMVDDRPINDQIHEFQEYVRHIQAKGYIFADDYKVSCLIDKLPDSWNAFARDLRHRQGELTFTQAINILRVEEQHRLKENPNTSLKAKVNLVENYRKPNFHSKPKNFKPKGKWYKKKNFNYPNQNQHQNRANNQNRNRFQNQKQNHANNQQSQNNQEKEKFCYVCGLTNHLSPRCYNRKTEPVNPRRNGKNAQKPQVNMVEGESSGSFRTQVEEV